MRTTIDIPEDLHELARQLAHESNTSMSRVITNLIRRGLPEVPTSLGVSSRGMPHVAVGREVSANDVRDLEDEG